MENVTFLGENVTFWGENVTFFGEHVTFLGKMSLFWGKCHLKLKMSRTSTWTEKPIHWKLRATTKYIRWVFSYKNFSPESPMFFQWENNDGFRLRFGSYLGGHRGHLRHDPHMSHPRLVRLQQPAQLSTSILNPQSWEDEHLYTRPGKR